ncbi:MAG: archease [Nitrospirota bacterium]|nr:archease [Nitrospirota bacterium]
MEPHWEHYHHQADIGVRGIGASREEAFEQAALALTAVITEPRLVIPREAVNIICEAPDNEYLLVDWLNSIIYEIATRNMLFSRFEVHIENHTLTARLQGERADQARHQPAVEVKGATYTTLSVGQNSDGSWVAQTVVDV